MNSKQNPSTHQNSNYTHWIHCNVCYKTYIQKDHAFYLLACNHVTCERCIAGLEQPFNGPHVYKCPLCQKIVKACEINNTMPKNLKELFHPQPFMDGINNFRIMTFQDKHRQHFLAYQDTITAQIEECRKNTEKMKEDVQRTCQEYEEIKRERRHLEKRVKLIRQQRRDIDDNRSNKSLSSSSSERSSLPEQKGHSDYAVTSFSNMKPSHSFLL